MIPAKPLDWEISNIKYQLGKYYERMGLTPTPKVRVCRDFSNPPSLRRGPYVINKWPLIRSSSHLCLVQVSLPDFSFGLVEIVCFNSSAFSNKS